LAVVGCGEFGYAILAIENTESIDPDTSALRASVWALWQAHITTHPWVAKITKCDTIRPFQNRAGEENSSKNTLAHK